MIVCLDVCAATMLCGGRGEGGGRLSAWSASALFLERLRISFTWPLSPIFVFFFLLAGKPDVLRNPGSVQQP